MPGEGSNICAGQVIVNVTLTGQGKRPQPHTFLHTLPVPCSYHTGYRINLWDISTYQLVDDLWSLVRGTCSPRGEQVPQERLPTVSGPACTIFPVHSLTRESRTPVLNHTPRADRPCQADVHQKRGDRRRQGAMSARRGASSPSVL